MTMTTEYLTAAGLAAPGGHYSHAAVAGGLVFISGQLPIAADGRLLADRPFDEQAEQALANLLAVAAAAGCGPRDLVRVTVYIVGIENWPRFNALYAAQMGDAVRPARAIVPVPELHYGALVEIEGVAVRPG